MALEEEFDTEIPDEKLRKSPPFRLPLITSTATRVSEHLQAVVRPPEFYLFVPLNHFFPPWRTNVSKRRVVVTDWACCLLSAIP